MTSALSSVEGESHIRTAEVELEDDGGGEGWQIHGDELSERAVLLSSCLDSFARGHE